MSLYQDMACAISNNEEYKKAKNTLFQCYVRKLLKEDNKLEDSVLKKLATAAQYFYYSESEKHRIEGSNTLAMLLDVAGDTSEELLLIAEHIYNKVGDYPNIELLHKKYKVPIFYASIQDKMVAELKIHLNTIDAIDYTLTDYQRTLWEYLWNGTDIVTTAPTSTGKTYIVLNYILEMIKKGEEVFAVVVVPTRALISEQARLIRGMLRKIGLDADVDVVTIPKEVIYSDKTVFVMTQERLFEVLQREDIDIDYLFVDEAHNISNSSRGVLLHLVLQKVFEYSEPQVIVSMPSIAYKDSYDSVFNEIKLEKHSTSNSPVSKVFMSVQLIDKIMKITQHNTSNTIEVKKEFKGRKLASIVERLGSGEKNIVYRSQTNLCENTAQSLADLRDVVSGSEYLEEAADYIESFLHPNFSLASNLRKGVAFHYGPLPSVIRRMVEDLARSGELDYIVCTNTLAEGVNLPAKNLFLSNPIQPRMFAPSERLENVLLDNITGRAGRMLKHFTGNVFLVSPEKWKYKDYFEEQIEKQQIPTYYKVINEDLDMVVRALKGVVSAEEDKQYTYYTIANKLVRDYDREELDSTFKAKELSLGKLQAGKLMHNIILANGKIKLDRFTLEANPTIGYIQQSNLYNELMQQDNIEEWILPHPLASNLYERLLSACNLLQKCGIYSLRSAKQAGLGIGSVCLLASKWMRGISIRSIIEAQIVYWRSKDIKKSPNTAVRNVIKVIDDDVRFRMTSALNCYDLILSIVLAEAGIETKKVQLHTFIEIGACQERICNLIGMNLSREAAIEIDRLLHNEVRIESLDQLRSIYNAGQLVGLHRVLAREIIKLIEDSS